MFTAFLAFLPKWTLQQWLSALVALMLLAAFIIILLLSGDAKKWHGKYDALVASDKAEAALVVVENKRIAAQDAAAASSIETAMDSDMADLTKTTGAIHKDLSTYVSPKANAGCTVTRGAVQLFNAGATSTPPPTPAGPTEVPNGPAPSAAAASASSDLDLATTVQLSDVIDTANYNAGVEGVCAVKYKGWQDFYGKLKADRDGGGGTLP